MVLHSGNIMLEERKFSADEMNGKIAIRAKEERENRLKKLPETEQNQLKNEIRANLQREDNYVYGYRIIDFGISKEAENEEDRKMNMQQF
jgi:hypothetical protein